MKNSTSLLILLLLQQVIFFSTSLALHGHHHHKPKVNVTIIGTVFCDICSKNTFTKHSYFLPGTKVEVQCNFKVINSTSKEEISITVDRKTDRYGIYRVDVPPVDGFECRQGREIQSFCRARLIQSSSSLCNVPGLSTSVEHLAMKFSQSNLCIYNLNALNYKPSKKNLALCETPTNKLVSNFNSNKLEFNSSLFFWPPFPPFTNWNLPHWPLPLPFFYPPPSSPFKFSFPFPSSPPSFPFKFPLIPFFSPPSPPPLKPVQSGFSFTDPRTWFTPHNGYEKLDP
ncbi:hypothetical protein ZOSMA_169G00070 [Zostera marina]|uniref:Pollen Ole e 1 allergen and extensin family protein n=1 Tax=Zostera marina TaxID=29655 RepID=A0A0K9PVE9_ZOSMR|nr:hypothetical protein ZOSMA_169G00070 [Zostera marina]